jgi:TPR repeat protein
MAGEGTAHDLQEAAVGWRESADQGDASAQLLIGALYGRGGGGVKRNLPLGKRYLELSAVAGYKAAVALLKELRKCVACGELDVHHMICSQCRSVRFCDKGCQLQHWEDSHKLHCVQRRESAGAGGSLACVEPQAHQDILTLDQFAAAAAARETGNDLFRKQKYPEVCSGINRSDVWLNDSISSDSAWVNKSQTRPRV